jgi:glycosyltransferase involved in cell wall biosynthesis
MPASPRARIAFINTHPIQYFAPLYRYINAHSKTVEAVPVYLTNQSLRGAIDPGFGQTVTWDIDLLSGMDPIFAKGAETRELEFGATKMIVPDVWRIIRGGNFDAVVVHGHRIGANHVAWAAAKSKGLPVFTRGEMHLELQRSGLKTRARDLLMPMLFKLYDGVLAIGSANHDYYRYMGVPEARISHFPYSVDNDRLIAEAQISAAERAAERDRLGVSQDGFVLLYASKFQHRKHPDDLIHAAARLAKRGIKVELVLAGSGDMDDELRALAAQHPDLTIRFPGFFNQSALPRLFAACDAFALPSENEPWGLIVNEAMCAGLPVIVSREVGCVRDMVHAGINGAVFDAGDVEGLAAAIAKVAADALAGRAMGACSIDIVRKWGYRDCLLGLETAFARTQRNPTSA